MSVDNDLVRTWRGREGAKHSPSLGSSHTVQASRPGSGDTCTGRRHTRGFRTHTWLQNTHVASELSRDFRTHTCLQNCRVSSELPRVLRTVACIQNCHPKACVCSSTCVQNLCWWCRVRCCLPLDHGHTQHARRARNTGGRVGFCSE